MSNSVPNGRSCATGALPPRANGFTDCTRRKPSAVRRPAPARNRASGVALCLMVFLVSFASATSAAEAPLWQADYQRALQLGRETGRPVLLHFGAAWCVPCQKMEREVFATQEVRSEIAQKFVAVRIDYDRDRAVASRYDVQVLPTDIILDPVDGRLVARTNQPLGAIAYRQFLQQQSVRYQQLFAVRKPVAPPAATAGPQPAASPRTAARPQQVWYANYEEALAAAERLERPLLIHFYGPNCPPCRQMERDVFSSPDVQRLLAERFVAVKVDGDRLPALTRHYNVDAYPTDVVQEPFNGRVVFESGGFLDRNGYLAMLSQTEARFAVLVKSHLAAKAANGPAETPEPARPAAPVEPLQPQVRMGEARPLIALDGFSPVALFKGRRWARGRAAFAWQHQGLIYYMESREELEAFRATPDAYAPQFQGCDPVVLAESDRAIAGDARFAAFYDDRLYLFSTAENREKFQKSPAEYLRLKHVIKPSRIEGLRHRLGDLPDEDSKQVLRIRGTER